MEYCDDRVKKIWNDGATCYYCGHKFSESMEGWYYMTLDHVVARVRGGGPEHANLKLCCRQCNTDKGSMSFDNGDSILDQFKERQKLKRAMNEQWVEDWMRWLNGLRDNNLEIPNAEVLVGNLCKSLEEAGFDARKFGSGKQWVEFNRPNDNRLWYFDAVKFRLQPWFLHKQDTLKKQDLALKLVLDKYEEKGYFKGSGDTSRCKYLRPFHIVEKGVNDIKNEVREVEDIWEAEHPTGQ